MARDIPIGGANTNDQNLKNANWRYGIRFVLDANTTIYRFFWSLKALGSTAFTDQTPGTNTYGKGDGGTIAALICTATGAGHPNLSNVVATESPVSAATRYFATKTNYGISTVSAAVYSDFGGVALTANTLYWFVIRNSHADPANNYFSYNSLTMKESAAGPNGVNTLDANATGAVCGLDPRECSGWSTDAGTTWVYGRLVGTGYYAGDTTSDAVGTRLPMFGWSTASGNAKPAKFGQPYLSYPGTSNRVTGTTFVQQFPSSPRAVTLTQGVGYAPVGYSVGAITITNTTTGVSGTTASLGTGIQRGTLSAPVPVAVGDTYTAKTTGSVLYNPVDNWCVQLYSAGVPGSSLPFRSNAGGSDSPNRMGLAATPDPWLLDRMGVVATPPTFTAKLWNTATDTAVTTIANGATINTSVIPTNYDIIAEPSESVGSVKFNYDSSTLVRSETVAPYSLDDTATAGMSFTLGVGSHTLVIEGYSGTAGTGTLLGSTTISFTVSSGSTLAPTSTAAPVSNATLTCSPGAWSGTPPPSFTYQWKRNGVAISGATANTYVLQDADENVKCTVTATNASGSSSADSNVVAFGRTGIRVRVGDAWFPSSGPSGTVLWEDDFERTSVLGTTPQKWGNIEEPTGTGHQATLSTTHARDGAKSLRTELRSGEVTSQGHSRMMLLDFLYPTGTYPANVLRAREGDEWYQAMSFWFQDPFPGVEGSYSWNVFFEWTSFDADGNGPLKLVHGGANGWLAIEGKGDAFNTPPGGYYWMNDKATITNGWHDFVFHIKFSQNPAVGFLEIWHREPNEGAYARQTFISGAQREYFATLLDAEAYMKLGQYRATQFTQTAVMFADRIKIGTTFDSVAVGS